MVEHMDSNQEALDSNPNIHTCIIYIHICVHTQVGTYVYMYICIDTYINIYLYISMFSQKRWQSRTDL